MVDILTVAASLAAQAEERPWATLVPHVLPGRASPGFPPYSVGAVPPRTSRGRAPVGHAPAAALRPARSAAGAS